MSLFMVEGLVYDETTYGGIVNFSLDQGLEAALHAGGSLLDPTKRCIAAGRPVLSIDTVDLGAWLPLLFNTAGDMPLAPVKAIAEPV